jgi:hypothetical protein
VGGDGFLDFVVEFKLPSQVQGAGAPERLRDDVCWKAGDALKLDAVPDEATVGITLAKP